MNAQEIDRLKQNAWIQTKAELLGMNGKARAAITNNSTPEEIHAAHADQLLPYVIAHLTRSEAALAAAVGGGIIPPQIADALITSLRGFCMVAAQGRRAFCQKAPCDWKGEVSDAGPVGVCPLCKAAPVKVLEIMVPPSAGNGKLRLVDGL